MSVTYGPPAPAGSIQTQPPHRPGAGGPPGAGGQQLGEPANRPRRRGPGIAAVGVALAVAAALGGWLAVRPSGTATVSAVPGASGVAVKVDPGVVDVTSVLGYQRGSLAGTGIVVKSSGEVLTNNHVIEGATSVTVTDVGNGRTYRAAVAGCDVSHDIAVLRLQGASGLKTVTFGDSSKVRVGDKVVALGNAGGKGGIPAAATGTVTGLGQSITAADQAAGASEQLTALIRTDAAAQSGDSGGPLVNTAGQVIGLDTAASTAFQIQPGATRPQVTQAFAIPADLAASVARQIEAGSSSATVHIGPAAILGVLLETLGTPWGVSTEVVVAGAEPGSPAADAGLAAGDVIVSLGGHGVTSASDIQAWMVQHHPGDHVAIHWVDQAGQAHETTAILATGPAG